MTTVLNDDENDQLNYLGADDLVFNLDKKRGIYSGGFSVNSAIMRAGMTPIRTLNMNGGKGKKQDKVSDLFRDLVVPSWVLTYNNKTCNGQDKREGGGNEEDTTDSLSLDEDREKPDDIAEDSLHDKLINLVQASSKDEKAEKMEPIVGGKKKPTKRRKPGIKPNKKTKRRHK